MMRERGRQLEQQGLELCQRYESTGQPDHLVRGIALLIDAMKHAEGTGQQVIICGNLGTALSRYFELTSSDAALDDSITLLSAAVTSGLLGGEDLMAWTHGLRHSLRVRYDKAGKPADLDAAITLAGPLRGLPASFRPPPDIWPAWLSESAEDREARARLRLRPDDAAEAPRDAPPRHRRSRGAAPRGHRRLSRGLSRPCRPAVQSGCGANVAGRHRRFLRAPGAGGGRFRGSAGSAPGCSTAGTRDASVCVPHPRQSVPGAPRAAAAHRGPGAARRGGRGGPAQLPAGRHRRAGGSDEGAAARRPRHARVWRH